MSGYTDVAVVDAERDTSTFLQKPFTMNQLLREIAVSTGPSGPAAAWKLQAD